MPRNNAFRHQRYSADVPATEWHLLRPEAIPDTAAVKDSPLLASAGEAYRAAGVRAVLLIHGTFAGDDPVGLLRMVERVTPGAARRLHELNKSLFDKLAKDHGNYPAEYAREFERAAGVTVERVTWSGENHHVARAHAAVALIDGLANAGYAPEDRVLIWGHSHAGNVLALATNLLGAEAGQRAAFFAAGRCYYRQDWFGGLSKPVWDRVRELLELPPDARRLPKLDLVTFGTPIRYGWDTAGYDKLLHFVNHRPRPGVADYRTTPPHSVDDLIHAVDGDYIQQFGISGTNFVPWGIGLRTWLANRRLARLLQAGIRRRDLFRDLRAGQRVPDEGEALLVAYPDSPAARQLAGHAIYTRRIWLPFHAAEVARRFYGWKPGSLLPEES